MCREILKCIHSLIVSSIKDKLLYRDEVKKTYKTTVLFMTLESADFY